MAHGSRLKAHGSCIKARGSRPRKMWRWSPQAPGPSAQFFLALSHEPWGTRHEPWAINNWLIHEFFDFMLQVLSITQKNMSSFLSFFILLPYFHFIFAGRYVICASFLCFFIWLPNFDFMLSGRYWSHIEVFPNRIKWIFIICPSLTGIGQTAWAV